MALLVVVKVVPSAGRQSWAIDKSGTLKCYLKNPAERGLANEELVKRLAQAAGVPQVAVIIVSGVLSRNKRVKIETNLTMQQLLAHLGLEQQQSLLGS
jgi:uncharacterized protein (TIGR00251 family)